jgi:SM-20-related protein
MTEDVQAKIFNQLADDLSEKGFGIIDSILSDEEVRDILLVLDDLREGGTFKKAGIGKADQFQVNNSQRGDLIRWIEPENEADPTNVYLDRMRELMSFINRTCYLGLRDFEFHYTVYPVGAFYKRHLDQFKKDDHRKLSVICYLNFDWKEADGGALRLFVAENNSEKTVEVIPSAGRMVCFRSDLLEHEVMPSLRERKSLTGWLRNQLIGVPF